MRSPPVAPPTKKQRASNVPPMRGRVNGSGSTPVNRDTRTGTGSDHVVTATSDAIARRRAELRRMQQRRGGGSATKSMSSTEGLLAKARSQLGKPLGGTPVVMNGGTSMAPPLATTNGHAPPLPTSNGGLSGRPPPRPTVDTKTTSVTVAAAAAPPPPPPPPQSNGIARRLDAAFAAPPSRAKSAPPARPPPPPSNRPMAAEAPPSTDRNHAIRPSPITPTLSTRRNLLNNLRDMADSPESTDLRLIKELKKAKQEKEDAFRKVARLQEQMQQLQKQDRKAKEIGTLLEVANKDGDRAAIQWARQQMSSTDKPVVSRLSRNGRTQTRAHVYSSNLFGMTVVLLCTLVVHTCNRS